MAYMLCTEISECLYQFCFGGNAFESIFSELLNVNDIPNKVRTAYLTWDTDDVGCITDAKSVDSNLDDFVR